MRTILDNFRLPDLSGPALTEEIRNLRQIQEQGWNPSLFEGLFLNSSHREELKRNPHHYGRILGDHDPVDPEKGIHVLLDAGKTRILELPPFAFSQLLAHQGKGSRTPESRSRKASGPFRSLRTRLHDLRRQTRPSRGQTPARPAAPSRRILRPRQSPIRSA